MPQTATSRPSGDLFRIYDEVGADGYPPEWHEKIKHLVREQAGHRCVRCLHPYVKGAGEWSACDEQCVHGGSLGNSSYALRHKGDEGATIRIGDTGYEARWRILTVHHLNGNKADCRWWNLASLCQRCHLRVQRVVVMERIYPWEHSEWFKPHAAGWYAHAYLGEDITREQAVERMDELLALERAA